MTGHRPFHVYMMKGQVSEYVQKNQEVNFINGGESYVLVGKVS